MTDQLIHAESNQLIDLSELDGTARVAAGSIALFAVCRRRRFLFTVERGGIVPPLALPPNSPWRLVAIPLEPAALTAANENAREVQDWAARLQNALGIVFERPVDSIETLVELGPEIANALEADREQRARRAQARFEMRDEVNARLTGEAVASLTNLHPESREHTVPAESAEDAFLEGVRATAAAMGIVVPKTMAAAATGPASDKEQLRAIAHRSGFRTRHVVLSGSWWTQEYGPLFGHLKENHRPVALLPDPGSGGAGYVLYDPTEGTREPVNARCASGFEPLAHTFYRPLPPDLSSRGLLRFAFEFHRRDLTTLVWTGLGIVLMGLVGPQGAAILIDSAIPDADRGTIWQVAFGMFAAAGGSILFLLAQSVAVLRMQTAAYVALQSGVWDHLLKLGPSFFRRYTAGELLVRANALTRIQQFLTTEAMRSLFGGVTSALTVLLIFYYDAALGGIAILSGAVMVAALWLSMRKWFRLEQQWQSFEELLSGMLVQLIGGVSKLRVAGATQRAFAYWARQYGHKQEINSAIQSAKDRVRVVNATVPSLAIALSYYYLLGLPAGRLQLGNFLACSSLMTMFLTGLTAASENLVRLSLIGALWKRMQPILEAVPEVDRAKSLPGRLRGRISIENVTFRYGTSGPMTLDGISIEIEPGECVALTGPSGCGKSTLLNLLLRFEEPHSGSIALDGQDLSGLDVTEVRRQIGVVAQDGKIMSQSIYENICCGGASTMDEAWEAARSAGFAEDIESMPMGMHTVISEGGTNLSGGQRQRLLIARALLRKPSILIFDEATSALDNRTQAIVTDSLNQLRATRIVVAHRLSTIRDADRICVIDKGRVVEEGTFDQLVAKHGMFSRLISRQMGGRT
jgi:NHLM bacteriocin system ABC transporter ATP-binding protein